MLKHPILLSLVLVAIQPAASAAGFSATPFHKIQRHITAYHQSGSKIYFFEQTLSNGWDLWVSDGTEASTKNIKNFSSPFTPYFVGDFREKLYFAANDGLHGKELWKTDGTQSGTEMVKDLMTGSEGGFWEGWIASDKIFIRGQTLETGWELYVSDGTSAGTKLCKQFTGGTASTTFRKAFVWNSKLILTVESPDSQNRVWISDGTQAGTTALLSANQISGISGFLGTYGNRVMFHVLDTLWSTDGTKAGTKPIKQFLPPVWFFKRVQIRNDVFAEFRGKFYCVVSADTADDEPLYHQQMWETDGTTTGTRRIFVHSAYINEVKVVNNVLFFKHYGTALAGFDGQNLRWFDHSLKSPTVQFGNALYFSAYPSGSGVPPTPARIWKVTGIDSNPVQIFDGNTTEGASWPRTTKGFLYWTDIADINGNLHERFWCSGGSTSTAQQVGINLWAWDWDGNFLVVSNKNNELIAIKKANAVSIWEGYQ